MIERIKRKSLSLNFAKSTYFLICGFSMNLQTRCLLEYRLTNLNIYNYEKTIIYLTTPCAGGTLFLQ